MPVGISSAARNLFLLGSSGADVVTNFFKAIDQSSGSDDGYITTGLGVGEVNVAYLGQSNYNEYHLSGTKTDGNSKINGWVDKRQEDGTLDWNVEVTETGGSNDVLLNDLYLDANHTGLDGDHEVIVCGSAGSVPFVSKYDRDGVVIWSATSQTADVTYNSVTSSSEAAGGSVGYEGDVYACGNTDISGSSYAVVEKFNGATGAPDWGKRFTIQGSDVVFHAIDTQPRGGYVVAGGYLQDVDNNFKGYFVKIESASGEIIWDRTLELTSRKWGTIGAVEINDICVDDNGFIYVVGAQFNSISGFSAGFICKYTPEGNMLWQKETPIGGSRFDPTTNTVNILLRWRYNRVRVDTQTGQIIILGSYHEASSDEYGVLIKYSSGGKKIFERIIESTETFPPEFGTLTHPKGGMALDADPSFYYVLFTDQDLNTGSLIPNKYTFGKVSSSGNGLGAFSYETGDTNTIEYLIHDIGDRIGKLSDGSVRNDTSDLATNILNPTKIMFDDLATPITNKKRQMDRAGDFVISGSPAVRPVDFQELNLLGDAGVVSTTGPTYSNGWAGSINNPTRSFDGVLDTFAGSNGGSFGPFVYTFSTPVTGVTSARLRVNLGATSSQVGSTTNVIEVDGTDVTQKAKDANAYANVGFQWIDVTTEVGNTWNNFSIQGTGGSTNPSIAAVEVNGTVLIDSYPYAWLDQSGKGNDAVTAFTTTTTSGGNTSSENYYDGGGLYPSTTTYSTYGTVVEDVVTTLPYSNSDWSHYGGKARDLQSGGFKITFSDNNAAQDFFMGCWVKFETYQASRQMGINLFGNYVYWETLPNGNVAIRHNGGNRQDTTGGTGIDDGNWHYISLSRNGNTLAGCVDGVAVITTTQGVSGNSVPANADFWFFGGSGTAYNIDGKILDPIIAVNSGNAGNTNVPTKPLIDSSFNFNNGSNNTGPFALNPGWSYASPAISIGGGSTVTTTINPTYNTGGYFEFDGTDNKVIKGPKCNTLFEDGGEGTIEMWVKLNDVSTRQTLCSGYISSGSTQPDRWDFEIQNAQVQGGFHDNGYSSSNPILSGNTWYNFIFVLDKSVGSIGEIRLYINGVESPNWSGNLTVDRDFAVDVELGIGNRAGQPEDFPFNGDIAEFRIYPKALTEAQVFQNYNSTKTKYTNELPDVAPKVGPGIVYGSELTLNYDFGNAACITKNNIRDRDINNDPDPDDYLDRNELASTELLIESPLGNKGDFFGRAVASADGIVAVSDDVVSHDFWFNGISSRSETPGSEVYLYNFGDAVDSIGSDNSAYEADFITTIRLPGTYWNRDVAKRQGALSVGDGRVVFTCDPYFGINVVENKDVTPMAYVAICDYRGNVLKIIHDPNTIDNARQLTPIGYNAEHLDLEQGVWVRDSSITTGFGHQAKIYKEKIYVADNANEKIFIYTLAGDLITSIGIPAAEDYGDYQAFGTYISLNDNILAVGASNDERNDPVNNRGCGSVYLFSTDDLSFLRKLLPSVELDRGDFGEVVEIGHDRIVVGQPQTFATLGTPVGHVELFDYDGNFITRLDTVNNIGDDLGSQAQSSFAITDKYVFVGYAQTGRGQVNVFDRVTGAHQGRIDPRLPLGETTGNFGRSMTTASNGYDQKLIIGNTKSEGKIYYYDLTKREIGDTIKNLSNGDYSSYINNAEFNNAGYFDFGDTSYAGNITTATSNVVTTCATLLGTTDSGGSCTAEAWVKFTNVSSQQVVLSGYASGDGARWDFGVNSGALEFRRYANGTTTQSSGSVTAGVWNHIAVTRGDGSDARIRLYLNGSEVGTSLLGGQLGSGEPFSIGMRSDGSLSQMFGGEVGEVRTYTRFLSAIEVSKNYNATRSKYGV